MSEEQARAIKQDYNQKMLVEAFLLSGASPEEIEESLGVPEKVVKKFSQLFYNVQGKTKLEKFSEAKQSQTEDEHFLKTVAVKYGKDVLECCTVGISSEKEPCIMGKIRQAMMEMFFDVNIKQHDSKYAKNVMTLYRALDSRKESANPEGPSEDGKKLDDITFSDAIEIMADNFKRGMK